jgi:hypothetical protein
MSPKVALLKPLSSAISIGTGGPFGAEGPIIMTGGAIGSLFVQCFHLSAAERKTLLVAGAVAGMTTIFGTPLAAVLLAVELLLFEWKPRSFIPVTVAAGISIAWRPLLFGAGALFPTAFHWALPWWGFLLCVGMGLISGLQSGLLTTLLYKLEDAFERLPIHWMWWPALGGLIVGLGGLIEPRALGVGYDLIADLLGGHLLLKALLAILIVKTGIRRRARRLDRYVASGRIGDMGPRRHGGHDGRHDACAVDRNLVRDRVDRRSFDAGAFAAGHGFGLCRHGALVAAFDPDREDRTPRPAHTASTRSN